VTPGSGLPDIVSTFARGIEAADRRLPQWVSTTTHRAYQVGIGPHPESRTIDLVLVEMALADNQYADARVGVPYPSTPKQRCDVVLGSTNGGWAIEVKMLRMLGDNNKPNDNILMHILSPYPAHRSALTDVTKLAHSGFAERTAIVIYGYEYEAWPMEPAIAAFETLAAQTHRLGERHVATFDDLVHPVHRRGAVFGWEVPDASGRSA
jgi:hypothetical protein